MIIQTGRVVITEEEITCFDFTVYNGGEKEMLGWAVKRLLDTLLSSETGKIVITVEHEDETRN